MAMKFIPWIALTIVLLSLAACEQPQPLEADVPEDANVGALLLQIHTEGTSPNRIQLQLESLAVLGSNGPDKYGWEFSSTSTSLPVVAASAEFQSNGPDATDEWSLLTIRIELDDSSGNLEDVAAVIAGAFDKPFTELDEGQIRWQLGNYRELSVSNDPAGTIQVRYAIAQGDID